MIDPEHQMPAAAAPVIPNTRYAQTHINVAESGEVTAELKPVFKISVADICDEMAKTFRERNAVYGDNYKMVAKLVAVLWPNGVPSELVVTHQWHLFELILVKLSRFAISDLSHVDSIHDSAVYGAMIEMILRNGEG